MPTPYELTSGTTGRTYVVEFDNDPSQQDIDEAIALFDAEEGGAPTEPPSYLSQLGTAFTGGTKAALAGGRASLNVLTGDVEDTATALADYAAAQRELQAAESPEDVAFMADLRQQAAELQAAEGVLPTIREAIDLPLAALRQPGAALKTAVQSLPNAIISTPITLGAAAGSAALGAAAGLPTTGPGAIATGIAGGIAGGTAANAALEIGAAAFDILNERTGGRATEMTREEIAEALRADPTIMEEAQRVGAIRGATIGAVDALSLGAAGRVAGTSRRAIAQATRRALVDQGIDLADTAAVRAGLELPAVKAAQEATRAGFTTAGELARGAAGAAIETGASGVGELAAQAAAGQETDYADAFLEMLGEGVAAPGSVIAAKGTDALSGAGKLVRATAANIQRAEEVMGEAFPNVDELEAQVGREAADAVAQAVVDAGAPVGQPTVEGELPIEVTPPATPTPATPSIALSPSPNLAPRATENAPPRPVRQPNESRQDFVAREDEWDATYGRTHNEDGTPYQPTVLDETVAKATSALQNKSLDERIDAVGTDVNAELGTGLTQLLDDGWVWDDAQQRMVDPQNRGETPIQALQRIRGQTPTAPANQPSIAPQAPPAPAKRAMRVPIPGGGFIEVPVGAAPQPVSEPTPITPVESLPAVEAEAPAAVETQTQPEPQTPTPNAPQIRQIPEDGQLQRQDVDEGGPTAEAGGGNRPVEGGQVQQEVTPEPVQPMEAAPAVSELPAPQTEVVSPSQPLPPTGGVPTESLPAGQPTSGDVGTALRAVATNTATPEQVQMLKELRSEVFNSPLPKDDPGRAAQDQLLKDLNAAVTQVRRAASANVKVGDRLKSQDGVVVEVEGVDPESGIVTIQGVRIGAVDLSDGEYAPTQEPLTVRKAAVPVSQKPATDLTTEEVRALLYSDKATADRLAVGDSVWSTSKGVGRITKKLKNRVDVRYSTGETERVAEAYRLPNSAAQWLQNRQDLSAVATNTATPEQVASLEAQGLARTVQGQPVITDAGLALMPEAERPRLTEAERVAEIEGQRKPTSVETPVVETVPASQFPNYQIRATQGERVTDKDGVNTGWVRNEFTDAVELVSEDGTKRAVFPIKDQRAYADKLRALMRSSLWAIDNPNRIQIEAGEMQARYGGGHIEDIGVPAGEPTVRFTHATSTRPGQGRRTGYYPGTYAYENESGLLPPVDGRRFSGSLLEREVFTLQDADALKQEASDAGFGFHSGNGNSEVAYLRSKGFKALRRASTGGTEIIVFNPDDAGFQPDPPTNTPPANVQPSIRPLQGDQQRNETLARRKRPRPSSPTVLRARDGQPLPNITVTADNAAKARDKESRQVPGASETWIGTTEQFLAEFADTDAGRAVEGNAAIEAFYDSETDRAVVLTDRVQVLEGDARRAVRNGTSAAEEAVRRLIRHEAFVHRGWRALPSDLRSQFLALSDSVPSAEDLDAIAKTYRRYANWRDDPSLKALAFEEWLAQRIERIEKLPAAADGALAQVREWVQRVWQWLTGDDSLEATPTELADVIRQMVRALETGEKEVAVDAGIRPSIFGSIGDLPPYFGENQGAPFDLPRDAVVPEPREPSPQLIGFWERLATTPEVFKYPTTDSADPAVVAEVFSTPESQLQAEQVTDNVIVLAGPNEGQATINLDPVTKRAVININTRGGPSGQLYQAALTLVHNLGFKKEQLNLSPRNAASRVVSNLLSSALRHGTTAHIDNSALPNLPWREGDDGFNVASMADYEARFVEANLPKLFTRPPDARGILRSENLRRLVSPDPVTLGQVDSWVRELANDPVRAASYGIGPATLVRHAITRLASSGEITPEQGRLAGEDGGVRLLYSLTQDPNADTLRRIVSEASEGPEATSQAQPFAPGVTPDMPLQQLADGRMAEANLRYGTLSTQLQKAKAKEMLDAMGPIGEWGPKLLSPEWRASNGLDLSSALGQYVLIEGLRRAQGRMNDATTEGIAAKRSAAIIAGLQSGTGTNQGQGFNARMNIQRDPEYAPMFVVQGAMELTNKTAATVVDPQVNVPAATDAVAQGDEQARQQATDDLAEELRLRDLIYDMGIAAQDAGIAERIRRINDNVFRLGVIERMRAAMAASGVAPSMVSASRAAVEQQYEGFTLEQLEAEATRLRDEIRQDVAAVEQAAKATPRKGRKGTDPVTQAKNLIDQLEAGPQVKKTPKPNPVRDLYRKHLKEPMAQGDFTNALLELGITAEDAQKLFDLAAIKIAAAQATNTQAKLSRYLSNDSSALASALNNIRSKTEGAPTWAQLFNQPFETQRQWRQRFYEALRADPALANLTPQETRDLAAALDKVWNDKRERNLQSILKRANLPGSTEKTKQKIAESVPLLLRYLNTGVFNDDAFRAAVAKKFGAKVLGPDDLARISELAQEAQKDGITQPERNAKLFEMVKIIQQGAGVELGEVISNYWVTAVLSGFRTQFDMALSSLNGLRVMAQTAADVAIRKRDFKMVGKAARDYFKTIANTILESANYFVTGDPTLLDGYQYTMNQFLQEGIAASNPFDFFEQVIKDPRRGPWSKVIPYFFAGIQRAMRIWDHVNSTSVKAGMLPLAMALNPEKYKDARMPSTEDIAQARDKAKAIVGGDTTYAQKRKVTAYTRQILDDLLQSQYPGLLEEAREVGFIAAYQNDPTGIGGIIYHTLLGVTKKFVSAAGKFRDEGTANRANAEWSEARKIVDKFMREALYILASNARNLSGTRFVRFVGNRVNELISFTPIVGLARLAEKDMTESKKSMIVTNQVVGGMISLWVIASMMRAMEDEEDEDKRGWNVEGSWSNLTPQQKNQRRAEGRIPYSLKIGGVNFNYNAWPMASLFATVGNLYDMKRYRPDKWNEKEVLDKTLSALWAGGTSFMDLSSLSGLMDMLGRSAYSSDPVEGAKQWAAKFSANYVGGFIPRALKDLDAVFDPEMRKPDNLFGYFAKEIPFYRRTEAGGEKLYDVFGEPVQVRREPWSRSFTQDKLEAEYQLLGDLNERGIFLSPANPDARTVGSGVNRRELTKAEAEAYMMETGKLYKDYVLQQGERLKELDFETAKAKVSKDTERLRNAALRRAISTTN